MIDMRDDARLKELADACALVIRHGIPTVTLTLTGKAPAGFPRGELLSVNPYGGRNYAFDPVRVLAFLHKLLLQPNNNK